MKKRVSMTVLFYIKRTKLLKNGEAPIYMRITLNGTKAELAINRSVNPKDWSSEKGAGKGNSLHVKQLNAYMETLRYKLYEHLRAMREDNELINAKSLRDHFLGKGSEERTILKLIMNFIKEAELLIGKDYAEGTVDRYKTTYSHINDFLQHKFRIKDMLLEEVNHKFIQDFEVYLKTIKGHAHNTAMGYIKKLKKLMRIALAYGWIKQDPFALFKITEKKVDRKFLTEAELKKIIEKDFGIERLDQVKDSFLISCFTGLAHADLRNLAPEHIVEGFNKSVWISIKRKKTNNESRVPLLPVAQQILAKYHDHPCCVIHNRLLPVLSNQKMNAYLKEIADLCGIRKKLTSHIARHTFATTVTLNNDIPFETVSKMLGHSSHQTTRIYAKLLDKKVGEDMSKLQKLYV